MAYIPAPRQLGIELDETVSGDRAAAIAESRAPEPQAKDYFVERDGRRYAGVHLLADLWGGRRIADVAHVEAALRDCAAAAGATLLHIHLHRFTPSGGISGVAVLAESHISVHTWPERGFAAFDIFLCGNTAPDAALAVLRRAFRPRRLEVSEHLRGEER